MIKIRLQKTGRKSDPFFKIVLVESKRAAISGKALDYLGFYNPVSGEKSFKTDKIKEWIAKGAQVSETVHNFLVDAKIIEKKKKNVLSKKNPLKKKVKETK